MVGEAVAGVGFALKMIAMGFFLACGIWVWNDKIRPILERTDLTDEQKKKLLIELMQEIDERDKKIQRELQQEAAAA